MRWKSGVIGWSSFAADPFAEPICELTSGFDRLRVGVRQAGWLENNASPPVLADLFDP